MIVVFTGIFSCTDDITGLNQNTKDATVVPAAYLFTNAQKNIVDQMVSTNVNFNVFRLFTQQWTETTYTDESNYDVATRTIPDNHWAVLYRDVLMDLKESKKYLLLYQPATPAEEAENANRIAIIDILSAYSYSVLVDTFGDVPYTEALDVEAHPLPKYDDAETIYRDLISKLTVASNTLDSGYGSFDGADLIYSGDASKWKLFANSLRLKLAINMDDVDHAYASTQALAAVSAGVINNNSDNSALKYLSAQPNANPVFVDVVASGRDDFVPTSTIIDQMNGLNDPRRSQYFTQIGGIYEGGTPGASSNFANFSHIGDTLLDPTFEGLIMDASEVEFLLAEAVGRGIAVGGTAESHYNAAITASMNYWAVSASDIATYLLQPSVAYTTATGTWKQKIGEQAYLALYNRGFECWTSFRRLDFPALIAPATADESVVPTRLTYPSKEETLNATNNAAASAAIGGNTLINKLFWDVN